MIKRILNISFWTLLLLAFVAFEIYATRQDGDITCDKLQIELDNANDFPILTTAEEIHTELLQNYPAIENQKKKNLSLKQIENNVGQIPYLHQSDAYFHISGDVTIKTSPRKAILRVINKADQHFYLGSDTVVMPLSPQRSLRLLVANGELPKLSNSFFSQNRNEALILPDIYKKIFILATKIQEDEFLNALIDQIYVTPDQEFELIPKAGIDYIEFGDFDDVDQKLKRLKLFYIKGKEKINWTIYKSINLKYENQVVCTKK